MDKAWTKKYNMQAKKAGILLRKLVSLCGVKKTGSWVWQNVTVNASLIDLRVSAFQASLAGHISVQWCEKGKQNKHGYGIVPTELQSDWLNSCKVNWRPKLLSALW